MRRERWTLIAALAVVLVGASSLLRLQDVLPGTLMQFAVRQAFAASLGDWAGWLRLALPLALVPLIVVALVVGTGNGFGNHCAIAATAIAAVELLVSVAPTTWFPDSTVLASTPSPALRFLQEGLGRDQYRMLGWPRTLGLPITTSLFGLADVRGAAGCRRAHCCVTWRRSLPTRSGSCGVPQRRASPSAPRPRRRRSSWRHWPGRSGPLLQGDDALHARTETSTCVYGRRSPAASGSHATVAVRAGTGVSSSSTPHLRPHAAQRARGSRLHRAERQRRAGPGPGGADDELGEVRIVAGNDRTSRAEPLLRLGCPCRHLLPGWTAISTASDTDSPHRFALPRGVRRTGTHRIVFRYQPLGFRLGLALAVVGLAVSAILIAHRLATERGAMPPK